MAKDKEFETLFNKYNLVVAKAQDLQEQLNTKQQQWQERDEKFATLEKIMRELCEDILAKDSKEMVLGSDYSWATTPIEELISKSKRVFKEYNAKRTDLMKKLLDTAEDRAMQIESLKEEIIQIKTRGGASVNLSREEIEAQIEKDEEKRREQEKLGKSVTTMSPTVQQAVKNGDVEIQMIKESIANGNAMITAEDSDDFEFFDDDETVAGAVVHKKKLSNKEVKLREDAIKKNNMAKITPKSVPMSETQKTIKDRKLLKAKLDTEYTMKVLSEFEAKISEAGWILIDVIGTYGVSKGADVINKALEIGVDNTKFTQSKFTTNLADLANIGVIIKDKVVTPFTKNFVYRLSETGARIYKVKYNKDACISEADKIIAEHDNLEHGYAIKSISELLVASGKYSKVEIWNRKDNTIEIAGGIKYVPDIVCTGISNEHTYIEYERDNWSQKSFNIKLNKMVVVTPTINFITSDKGKAISIMNKMVEWAKTKGNGGNMRNVILRVTTAKAIKGMDLNQHSSWMYTYRPLKDSEPVNNF